MKRLASLLLLQTLAFGGCGNPDHKELAQTSESVAVVGASKEADSIRASSFAPSAFPTAMPATPPAIQDPSSPARDADQRWLRRLADRQAVIVSVSHTQMSRHDTELLAKTGIAMQHDMSKDPSTAQDSEHDAELQEILGLLRDVYEENYAPNMTANDRKTLDSLQSIPESTYDNAFRSFVIREHLRELAIIDGGMPLLRRSDTRSLARRLRRARQQELAQLSTDATHQ